MRADKNIYGGHDDMVEYAPGQDPDDVSIRGCAQQFGF
jgi:hypothetical protein